MLSTEKTKHRERERGWEIKRKRGEWVWGNKEGRDWWEREGNEEMRMETVEEWGGREIKGNGILWGEIMGTL